MKEFETFLYMGGYAFYVWTSYGLAALVLGLSLWLPWRRHRQLVQHLQRRLDAAGAQKQ
ncbi:MAG: heme exporter protein CcmD [Gammaproteobacteria bacterium]|jgi:heme exporter protein D